MEFSESATKEENINSGTMDALRGFSGQVCVKLTSVQPAKNENGTMNFVCARCLDNPVFVDFQSLVWHNLMSHSQTCTFYCDLCLQTLGISAFARHVGKHLASSEKKYAKDSPLSSTHVDCKLEDTNDSCVTIKVEDKANDDSEDAKPSLRTKVRLKKLPHQCKTCGKQCPSSQQLRLHCKKAHAKRFKCDVCEKEFRKRAGLKSHYMSHTGEKPYVCAECGKQFSQLANLKRHELIHKGEKPFICPHCGRTFAQKALLKLHEANIHLEDKGFQCDVCKKQFGAKDALKNHMRIHTGEKPYSCSVCGKSFSMHGNLSNHRRVHTGEKPHLCILCGKAFKQSSHLKTHMRSHSSSTVQCPANMTV